MSNIAHHFPDFDLPWATKKSVKVCPLCCGETVSGMTDRFNSQFLPDDWICLNKNCQNFELSILTPVHSWQEKESI